MNQKVTLGLFLLGATVFNIVLMLVFILLLGYLLVLVLGPNPNQGLFAVLGMVVFIGSIVLSFLIYNRIMKWLQGKYQLEKRFPQLFRKK